MTITEALESLRATQALSEAFEVQLACSFTPLHLKTLLAGHLQNRVPDRRVKVGEGIFGDLNGTLEASANAGAIAVAMEWQDLHPRLRYREGGGWGSDLQADILETARIMLGRLEKAISEIPDRTVVAVSMPTLPLVPAFHPPSWQAGRTEILLERELADFAARITERRQVSLVNANWLSEHSPLSGRFDLKSDLLIGFPYSLPHADQLASALALLLVPRQPLKGVITDLDDTLWSGLIGETGADAVRWDPAGKYYVHGLYQKLLAALSDEGILVGIASKNDPAVVTEAFKRKDLLIPPEKIFPIEVHWAPKSESVGRILKTWNISADSVAFVDDTALELAEVADAHPGITCIQFPAGDYRGIWGMLKHLRDLCGKSQLNQEDALRLESIRQGAQFQEQATKSAGSDEFLSKIGATVEFDFEASPSNPRTLELVNKTNQFNLNGRRLTQTEWQHKGDRPHAFVATVKYEDKFGSLGTIAVLQGYTEGDTLQIETWVMSCRAFSRRIEHQTLKQLLERFRAASIRCDFARTAKNAPLQEFFATILGRAPEPAFAFTQEEFERACPALYHRVEEASGVTLNG